EAAGIDLPCTVIGSCRAGCERRKGEGSHGQGSNQDRLHLSAPFEIRQTRALVEERMANAMRATMLRSVWVFCSAALYGNRGIGPVYWIEDLARTVTEEIFCRAPTIERPITVRPERNQAKSRQSLARGVEFIRVRDGRRGP